MNKKRYEQTKQNELHDVQIIDKNIPINLSDLLLARLFDHSCKFAHTRCYSEKRASFWLEVGAVGMFGSWQTACGYNANIPMGKVSIGRGGDHDRACRESLGCRTKIGRVKNERGPIKQESSQEMKDPLGIPAPVRQDQRGARNTN